MIPIPPEIRSEEDIKKWMRAYFPRHFGEVMGRDKFLLAEEDPINALYRKYYSG